MSKPTDSFPARVCAALKRMDECREAEKTREADLVKHRKEVRDEFLALGPGETEQHKGLALDLVKTLLHIDYCRNHQRTLADKIGQTIRNADQPGLFEDEHDLEEISSREPEEEELFAALRKPTKASSDQQEFGDDEEPTTGEYAAPSDAAESIDAYLPGRYRDQNGRELNVRDMDELRSVVEEMAPGGSFTPRVSEAYGVSIDVSGRDGAKAGTLLYIGKARGRKAG